MAETTVSGGKTGWWRSWRARIERRPALNLVYRIGVGVLGVAVLAVGIVAIPYPGPGWLIVFAGLGILASEFAWAKTALRWLKVRYNRFMAWFTRQGLVAKIAGVLFTAVVVLATLWVIGTFSLVGGWCGIEWAWLKSPLAK